MKVFISSVRRGLEAERDSLVGLVMALGHEASRFEDFGAKTTPSREACLRGVAESDAYLLLLGPHYGHVFPETGQSATHDEWMAAVAKGMPKLVFRKDGVKFEPEQERFSELVGNYGHGTFYGSFDDVVDLQPKVVRALRDLEKQPAPLAFSTLRAPIQLSWFQDDGQGSRGTASAWLELHVARLNPARHSARQMREMPEQLVTAMRRVGAIPVIAGAEPSLENDAVLLEVPQLNSYGWSEPRDGALTGVRVDAAGQVSLRWSLPTDGLGAILDRASLVSTVAAGLRLVGALGVPMAPEGDIAIGIGIGGNTSMISEGRVTGVARTSASISMFGSRPIRVEPDEAVTSSALDRGAAEVADVVVRALLDAFRGRR